MPNKAMTALLVTATAAAIVAALTIGRPKKSTDLQIDISGGFAIVPTLAEDRLEIAYLNKILIEETTAGVKKEVCNVEPVGTELMVLRGDIDYALTDPAPPDDRIFNLDGAVVKFPALEAASIPLSATRKAWPPSPMWPANPKTEGEWKDLQFVPSLTDHIGKSIDPKWRDNVKVVNGRVVLKGGTIVGTHPTDPTAEATVFKYEKSGSSITAASTDKAIYTVKVPDDKIEIVFTGAKHGFNRLVIRPTKPNQPVRLRMRGLHAMNSPPSYANDQELADFCAFYALVQPPPASAEWLRLKYVTPTFTPGPNTSKPSPGFFCDPNWF